MTAKPTFICSCCGKEREEWPALAFISPDNYYGLTKEEKENIAELNSDFCVIIYPEQTDRFIRCTLRQKVIDHCQTLDYGLWVSLSEQSFSYYQNTFGKANADSWCFGWLSNVIPEYEMKESVPMNVHITGDNLRPELTPHSDFDHPFVKDYFNGISISEAEQRIRTMLA